MNNEIDIPEAVQFYYESEGNLNAIHQIAELNSSGSKSKLSGLSLDEIKDFNLARLATMKAQVDFWGFAINAWENTWGAAINSVWPDLQETSESEYDDVRDLKYVWENGFYKQYEINNGYLLFGISGGENSLMLYFYFVDKNDEYQITNEMSLSELWKQDPEDDHRWTKDSLSVASLKGISSISLDKLKQESVEILEKLKSALE